MALNRKMGSIPKITHQIWLQGWDKLPEKYQENVRLLSEMNPDFEHKRWDENSLRTECAKLGKPYVDKFDSFEHFITKVDFGRYVVLYNYGGISIDTDMKPLRPLRNIPGLESEEFIISKSAEPQFYNSNFLINASIITVPGHHITKEIIDTIVSSQRRQSDYLIFEMYVSLETGPVMVNKIMKNHHDKIRILEHIYLEPCFSSDPFCKVHEDAIMDHQHAGSWVGKNMLLSLLELIYYTLNHYLFHIIFFTIVFMGFFTKSGRRIFHGTFRKR